MGIKRLEDCVVCEMVTKCDAHNTRGTWKHRESADPCALTQDEIAEDRKRCENLG